MVVLGCRKPLTDREWDVVDLICCGCDTAETARTLMISTARVKRIMDNLHAKLPGHRALTVRERVLYWRGKQLGAMEYRAGLRDEEGFSIVERDLPPPHDPASALHETLFPEID